MRDTDEYTINRLINPILFYACLQSCNSYNFHTVTPHSYVVVQRTLLRIRDRSLYSLSTPPLGSAGGVLLSSIHLQLFRRDSWHEQFVVSSPGSSGVRSPIQHLMFLRISSGDFLRQIFDSAYMVHSASDLYFSIDVSFCVRSPFQHRCFTLRQISISALMLHSVSDLHFSVDVSLCVTSPFQH